MSNLFLKSNYKDFIAKCGHVNIQLGTSTIKQRVNSLFQLVKISHKNKK